MENLETLIGNRVRVFRGGPESRDGILLDAKFDYLSLLTEKEGVIYYNLNHIKSVIKNSKDGRVMSGCSCDEDEEEDEKCCIEAYRFHELLEKLKQCHVRIDRGGPESRAGKLLDVFTDFLVLKTKEDGIIYYKTHHIKSISQITKDEKQHEGEYEEKCDYATGVDFQELLKKLKYSWVKINRGGPEKIEGVLVDSSEDYLVLTVKDEVNRIPTFHIRNISVIENEKKDFGKKKEEKEKEKTGDKQESEDLEKDDRMDCNERDEHERHSEKGDEGCDRKHAEKHEDCNDEHDEQHDEDFDDEHDEQYDENCDEKHMKQDDEDCSEDRDEDEEYDVHHDPPAPVWYSKIIRLN